MPCFKHSELRLSLLTCHEYRTDIGTTEYGICLMPQSFRKRNNYYGPPHSNVLLNQHRQAEKERRASPLEPKLEISCLFLYDEGKVLHFGLLYYVGAAALNESSLASHQMIPLESKKDGLL